MPSFSRLKFLPLLAALSLTAGLLAACGYPTPPGGGGLTPLVVVVTPTGLPVTDTPPPTTIDPNITATPTAIPPEVQSTIPPNTPAPTPKLTPTLAVNGDTYTVQAGDTLFGISKRLGVDYEDMVALNIIEDPNKLLVGQVLKIPPKPSSAADSTPTPKS